MLLNIAIQVQEYFKQNLTFETFSVEHIITLAFCLSIIIFIPRYANRKLNETQQRKLGAFLGWLIAGTYIINLLLLLASGNFDVKTDLPLQLCRFTNLAIVLVMVWRKYFWFEIIFFWAFAGMLQASFTPELEHGFPHWFFIRYWLGHPGVILCMVYAVVVFKFRPTLKSLGKSFVAVNVFMILIVGFNYLLDANYLWLRHKPVFPTLMDFCGPWPYYIIVLELLALIHFMLAYLPFYILERRVQRE